MKVIAIKSKRSIVGTADLLALVLAAAGVSIAWNAPPHYRLGAAYVASDGASPPSLLTIFFTPLDPDGRRAAFWHQMPNYAAESAALLTALGADAISDEVGEAEMINNNTFKWGMVAYAVKKANPPEIHGIIFGSGTGTFTGVNTL